MNSQLSWVNPCAELKTQKLVEQECLEELPEGVSLIEPTQLIFLLGDEGRNGM